MELPLHYVWKHRLYDATRPLLTINGEQVEVLDVGRHNSDAGPDFFNAKVKIDGTLWVGNVEVHDDEADWYTHGHERDMGYENTVLHVIGRQTLPKGVRTYLGKPIPTLLLPVPEKVRVNFRELMATDEYPRCHRILPTVPRVKVQTWLTALLLERMDERSRRVAERAKEVGWERAFFITLARNFGFGKNGDTFEQWARRLPLDGVAHHRDNLFQVLATFLGVAGLIQDDDQLRREYEFLCKRYGIERQPNVTPWIFMRMRPQSSPVVRIRQLAELYHKGRIGLAATLDHSTSVKKLAELFEGVTPSVRNLIIINTVVPVLWAYSDHQQRPELKDRALALLEELKCEQNYITRQWAACGVSVTTAAESQALIQLKRTRCDIYDCLRCRFAYEFMKIPNNI